MPQPTPGAQFSTAWSPREVVIFSGGSQRIPAMVTGQHADEGPALASPFAAAAVVPLESHRSSGVEDSVVLQVRAEASGSGERLEAEACATSTDAAPEAAKARHHRLSISGLGSMRRSASQYGWQIPWWVCRLSCAKACSSVSELCIPVLSLPGEALCGTLSSALFLVQVEEGT